jgi:hypothetical protein
VSAIPAAPRRAGGALGCQRRADDDCPRWNFRRCPQPRDFRDDVGSAVDASRDTTVAALVGQRGNVTMSERSRLAQIGTEFDGGNCGRVGTN